MAYKRQISYMDLIENELKRGNAGYVKWEKYDECHILSVFVNGLKDVFEKEVNVVLGNGHSIGKLKIKNGKSEGTFIITRGEKDWEPEIEMIRIPLGEEKELIAQFEGVRRLVRMQASENNEVSQDEIRVDNEPVAMTEEILPEAAQIEQETEVSQRTEYEAKMNRIEREEGLSWKSVWKRLSDTHELSYPFNDSVGCYRILPKDINMLHASYHSLQNNQFLMHGYYNYRHLIIFPKKDSENEFWLGVPGIYHEREKIAARMFGFEKFEGTKKEYRAGDLGYYLVTVEG